MYSTYKIWKIIKYFFAELFRFLKKIIVDILVKIWNKFINAGLPEKIIYLNIIPAFFAIILPVAQFYIFESYSYVNNPFGVHLIGIIIVMLLTSLSKGLFRLLVRILLNAYYLFWVIYIFFAGSITKARPYEICFGYYLNIAVPVIFISAALIGYFVYRE